MKKFTKLTALALLAAMVLSGCSSQTSIEVDESAPMAAVDSYGSKEVREYTDEGLTEEALTT